MPSSIDPSISPLKPHYAVPSPNTTRNEPPHIQALIDHLHLIPHIEGGYFVETDRDTNLVPNPFLASTSTTTSNDAAPTPPPPETTTTFTSSSGSVSTDLSNKLTPQDTASLEQSQKETLESDRHRHASTTIHYFLTPASPIGSFHRNKGRTVHTLHRGRGRYVIIHADEVMGESDSHEPGTLKVGAGGKGGLGKARVETFVVGQDVLGGERLQWIVDGGKYKASFLLPVGDGREEEEGLLISETVVPGFEYGDHDFMTRERFEVLLEEEQREELGWLVRKDV